MLTPKMELLIKKITHMWRRWGTPQNFFLAFIDELEKQIFIKNCWGRPIKNKIILICTNVPFFKKIKKYTCRDHNQNLNDMIYSSWDIEQNRLKLIILGHFLPFYPPNNQENQNFEKMKESTWRYYHFTHVYHKWQSYDVWFLRHGAR